MLRERNLFVLKARCGPAERPQALTLHVNVRAQDLNHFNGCNGTAGARRIERLLELLDRDEAFQALLVEINNDPRQLEQLVKSKSKASSTHTLELSDVTVQWQVSDESGLPSVLQRLPSDRDEAESSERITALGSDSATGKYRPLPVRQLVVAVWMYPPHVEIPLTGERIPASDIIQQDFFIDLDNDKDSENVNVDVSEAVGDSR